MTYQHLRVEEREQIQRSLWEKRSIRWIAEKLGRSPSSVAREVNKNFPKQKRRYTPRLAHERALKQRKSRGRTERLKSKKIREYVVLHLKKRWSPEQIAGRMRKDGVGSISPEAIYQFVYAQLSYGKPRRGCEDLRPFLRWKRGRRVPHGARRCQRVFKPRGTSIELRPKVVERKKRIGDWEGDTVESCDHKPGINTTLERKCGLVQITKLAGKTSADTVAVLDRRFRELPSYAKRTLTLDNGPENSDWPTMESVLGLQCFFAHPYRSCERGANENVNGLIRDYYPKKTDFTLVPDADIAAVEYALNTRPRKRLKYKTPLEVWSVALRS
jgi:IS30 family transposase